MSGHSHAKTIKHAKEAANQKRGQFFSKMAGLISVAVKQGGPNPETNAKLKVAIEKAKEGNMPKENIERAIKQASGGKEGANLEEVTFEAYGPAGIAVIIEAITDNKNRTLGEIKQILNQYNGKLVGEGAIKWLFERKGCITINFQSQGSKLKSKENLELLTIEAGAEDIYWYQDDYLDVYTKAEDLEKVKNNLKEKGVEIESSSLDWKPKERIFLREEEKQTCLKFFEHLDDLDSVQEIYSNLKE